MVPDQADHPGYVIIRLALVFAADPGKRIGGVVYSEHLGDTEMMTMSLVRDARCEAPATPDGDGFRVVEIATGAHFNDDSHWESLHRYTVSAEESAAGSARASSTTRASGPMTVASGSPTASCG